MTGTNDDATWHHSARDLQFSVTRTSAQTQTPDERWHTRRHAGKVRYGHQNEVVPLILLFESRAPFVLKKSQ